MPKGGQFERDICRELSLWWSHGKQDDVFWRTSTSGGRATTRAKKGKKTFGAHGDIQAVRPEGRVLLDRITLELKRGYNRFTPYDVVDAKKAPWVEFVNQVCRDAQRAGTPYWMLIHRRDKRCAVVTIPWGLYQELRALSFVEPVMTVWSEVLSDTVLCFRLGDFLHEVAPEDVAKIKRVIRTRVV